jgi:hypothetical protein
MNEKYINALFQIPSSPELFLVTEVVKVKDVPFFKFLSLLTGEMNEYHCDNILRDAIWHTRSASVA